MSKSKSPSQGKLGGMGLVIVLVLLYLGALVGGWLLSNINLNVNNAWIQGFIIALVQATILTVANLLALKSSLMTVLITALIIFVGGILGGFLAAYLNLSSLYATLLIVIVQTLLLSVTGYIKGGGTPKL